MTEVGADQTLVSASRGSQKKHPSLNNVPMKFMGKLLVLLCVLAVCLLGGWYYYLGTPSYSLHELGQAILRHDYETARYSVDEERLSNNISADATSAALQTVQGTDGDLQTGVSPALLEMQKLRLQEMANAEVKQMLGKVLGKDASLQATDSRTRDFDTAPYRGLKLQGITIVGKTAEATFTDLPKDFPGGITALHVRMARIPDTRRWRVVDMPDVSTIVAAAMSSSSR